MNKLMAIVGIVLVMCGMVNADFIAPPKGPPKEYTFTGTLAWEPVQKYAVWLEGVPKYKEINMGGAEGLPKTEEIEKLLGKKVTVKVMAHEVKDKANKKLIYVKKVISMTEAKP